MAFLSAFFRISFFFFHRSDFFNVINGCVPFATIASNLLAFSSKMADVAATSTDKRSVTLLATFNTRSVHAATQRAQQNLGDFTAIRPCFQQLLSTTWTTTYRAATSQQF